MPHSASIAVQNIKKRDLAVIRAFPSPPDAVKLALEAVMTLLGETDLDWKSMRALIIRDSFIPTILKFNAEDMT